MSPDGVTQLLALFALSVALGLVCWGVIEGFAEAAREIATEHHRLYDDAPDDIGGKLASLLLAIIVLGLLLIWCVG